MNLFNKIIGLKKKKFVRDSAVLQIGTFFSTALAFFASIIYARVLGLNGYASYGLIFAFVSLSSIFMNVGTNQSALTLLSQAYASGDKDKIRDICSYYLKVTFLVSLVAGFVIIILAPFLTERLYNMSGIGQFVRVIIFSYIIRVLMGFYVIILQVLRKIKRLAVVENASKLFYVIVPVVLVLFGYGLFGLVYGYLLVAFAFGVYAFFAYRRLSKNDDLLPSWRSMIFSFNRSRTNYYFKFGFLIAVDKSLGSLFGSLPILILGMFNIEYVAYLKIAIAYAALPLMLIGPIGRLLAVHLPRSITYGVNVFKKSFIRSTIGSFLITLVVAAVLAALGWLLIPFVYGSEYVPVIVLAYPLLAATVINSLGIGVSPAFRAFNWVKQSIIINTVWVLLSLPMLYLGIKYLPISLSIYIIALLMPIATIIPLVYLLKKINKIKA
jgi:O-antigen/teichoic acid export membrane protein